jgi:hypothetical protein
MSGDKGEDLLCVPVPGIVITDSNFREDRIAALHIDFIFVCYYIFFVYGT